MESGSLCSHRIFGVKLWLPTVTIFIDIQLSNFYITYSNNFPIFHSIKKKLGTQLETLKLNKLFKWAYLKLDGIWEFVFSQYFWGQVVIDDGDDFDGCDTFFNSIVKFWSFLQSFPESKF